MSGSSMTTTIVVADASDAVSSLRAAALSSRKSKRRKPADQFLPIPVRPPPPTESLALDYGADETTESPPRPAPLAFDAPLLAEETCLNTLPDQNISREEGEISEEEEEPPPAPPPRIEPSSQQHSETSVQVMSPISQPPGSLSPESGQQLIPDHVSRLLHTFSSHAPLTPSEDIHMTNHDDEQHERSSSGFSYFVRPGLPLTQDEYDTLKDVVLDLLGWGVPVDYLLQCGLSRMAVFYVFSELNLALPEGFDTSGLIPYAPEALSHHQASISVPSSPSSQVRDGSVELGSHTTQTLLEVQSPNPQIISDSHDLERQRRQELIARKAAQASRKSRLAKSGKPTNESLNSSLPASTVPPRAVDDFLNSLGSSVSAGLTSVLTIGNEPLLEESNKHKEASPLSSTATSLSTVVEDKETHCTQVKDSIPSQQAPDTNSRRGTKRPVAADFVDFDPAPRKNEINGRHERFNSGAIIKPRRQGSFVNVSSRRCVIDISDSEEDTDVEPGHQSNGHEERLRDQGNPNENQPSPFITSDTSPSILAAKEMEIKKMRELIQLKEERRLKKLATRSSSTVSGSATPASSAVFTAQPQTIHLKSEELDAKLLADAAATEKAALGAKLAAERNSESASPPAEIYEASLPVTRSVSKSPTVVNDVPAAIQALETEESTPKLYASPTSIFQRLQDPENFPTRPVDVDIDMDLSLSAQTSKSPTSTSRPQKHDERRYHLSPTSAQSPCNDNHPPQSDSYEAQTTGNLSFYRSPFESYPLLRPPVSIIGLPSPSTHVYPPDLSSHPPTSSFDHSTLFSTSLYQPDLKPLRLSALIQRLNPQQRLCRYEVPGGGTCRDEQCEDVHLSSLEGAREGGLAEPSDQETADYLFKIMPGNWLSSYQVNSPARLLQSLQDVRHSTNVDDLTLEGRVSEALRLLVPPAI